MLGSAFDRLDGAGEFDCFVAHDENPLAISRPQRPSRPQAGYVKTTVRIANGMAEKSFRWSRLSSFATSKIVPTFRTFET
jgi:hypothetical protein